LRTQLAQLREVAARDSGGEVPDLKELYRVKRSGIAMAVATLAAIFVLLTQVPAPGALWHALTTANALWLLLALAVSLTTNLAFAVALMGTTPLRLPLWATAEMQVGASFSNFVMPLLGGAALQIRFLQRQGANLATAIAAGGLLAAVGSVVSQLPLFVIATLLTPDHFALANVSPIDGVELSLAIVLILAVVSGLVFSVPRLRRLVLPSLQQGLSTVAGAVRSPRQLSLLLVGNVAAAILYGVCLLACLKAFGASASIWTLLSLSIGIRLLGALVPIAGAGAAVSTIGLSGALAAVGIDKDIAVAAALTNQLVVTYLPAIPGWLATRDLIDRDYL